MQVFIVFLLSGLGTFFLLVFFGNLLNASDAAGAIFVATAVIVSTICSCAVWFKNVLTQEPSSKVYRYKGIRKNIIRIIRLRDMGVFTGAEAGDKIEMYERYDGEEKNRDEHEQDMELLKELKRLGILSDDEYNEKLELLTKAYNGEE